MKTESIRPYPLWSPIYRDINGHLHAVNLLAAISNLDVLRFPLDEEIRRVIERERAAFEECLVLAVDISQMLP